MKTNLIIGTGELGSRHLQGLLKYSEDNQCIYAFDISDLALENSKIRANEIDHDHEIIFTKEWSVIPEKIDLAIIATNSDIREPIITKLLSKSKIKYMVLEKVLFNNIEAFENVSNLLKSKRIKTWVNHPRRIYPSYLNFSKDFNHEIVSSYQVTGGNWGLACNGLHFIDLFTYLSKSRVTVLDADWVDNSIIDSKRNGFIEFTGTIKGRFENGSTFQINSFNDMPSAPTITIQNAKNRYIIQETGKPESFHLDLSKDLKWNKIHISMEFQSSLTTKIASDIFSTENCLLPLYDDAKNNHTMFIRALMKRMSEITNQETTTLPIT